MTTQVLLFMIIKLSIMLITMRHAERGDQSVPERLSHILYDPPISLNANELIDKTVKEYIDLLKRQKIKRIRIVSSPFLRCLMTAEAVYFGLKQQLQNVQIKEVEIEERLSQYLRIEWFSAPPMDKLVISGELNTYLKLKYNALKQSYSFQFPEKYGNFCKRVKQAKIDLLRSLEAESCTIIVTHGFAVRQLCMQMYSSKSYFQDEIPYCGYQAEGYESNNRKILKLLKDKHLVNEKL